MFRYKAIFITNEVQVKHVHAENEKMAEEKIKERYGEKALKTLSLVMECKLF